MQNEPRRAQKYYEVRLAALPVTVDAQQSNARASAVQRRSTTGACTSATCTPAIQLTASALGIPGCEDCALRKVKPLDWPQTKSPCWQLSPDSSCMRS